LLLGYPAGPDSITLLNLLYSLKEKLKINIFVAHINHGIRDEANSDEEYVVNYCKKRNIPCFVKRVEIEKIAKKEKIGTEEAGRKIRYEFFEEIYQKEKANRIATAHTANDNAETVLMNLIRGTGTSGLKGIEPVRSGKYIRPLIECSRKQIEEYAKKEKLNPCIDKTNFENIYTRNKVRNKLIPILEQEYNPNIISALNRMSDIMQEEENYWKEVLESEYKKIVIEEKKKQISLNLKEFQKMHPVMQGKLIRYVIEKLCGSTQKLEKIHVEDIRKMCQKNIGNKYLVPFKGLKVEVKAKRINVTTMS